MGSKKSGWGGEVRIKKRPPRRVRLSMLYPFALSFNLSYYLSAPVVL